MRRIQNALIATAVVGLAALTASGASAQYAPRDYGWHGGGGRYYSYGADHRNPSFAPHSYDQDNPRDQQLQGHN